MTSAAATARVNDNATGVWSARVGTELELVGPGANQKHCVVRRPGEKRSFCLPTSWLDGEAPEPERCPTCGREMP